FSGGNMSRIFRDVELAYLTESKQQLARIATVGRNGLPHVVPTGFRYNPEAVAIDIGGQQLEHTKKYRDTANTGVAVLVIDAVLPPWYPRGSEFRGRAEIITEPDVIVRVRHERIITWGLDGGEIGTRHGRNVDI